MATVNKNTAEVLAETLHDFNPNLNVNVHPLTKKVHATIPKLAMKKEDLHTLADIVGRRDVVFDRSGGKLRMVIG